MQTEAVVAAVMLLKVPMPQPVQAVVAVAVLYVPALQPQQVDMPVELE